MKLIGRAVEMGRASLYAGSRQLTTRGAPTMFATMDILAHISQKAARMDVDFITTTVWRRGPSKRSCGTHTLR